MENLRTCFLIQTFHLSKSEGGGVKSLTRSWAWRLALALVWGAECWPVSQSGQQRWGFSFLCLSFLI